ncbi:transcriptional regulator [Desulfosarcina alkanivorans]|uniref:Transcriptional regulator n=1 Tax=Desulfosarcina alkanivorans TaxID=571177 RepID=A0A5K7YDL7_9BACT|nr:winged helix-turn-helix transcriptional regulator [Desulfosarcina alkanivorans]BBO67076.1 transcriptional regulator [Desulfosarcina alkanivorans]
MNLKSSNTLLLLEIIAEEKETSQRYFSDTLNISLGLVNSFIKRLVKKGYCKVTTLPGNRIKYILTPSGAMEKTRLTYEYILSSFQIYKTAKNRLQKFFTMLEGEGARRVIFYGTGELCELAHHSMEGTQLDLIDVVDPSMAGERFSHLAVKTATRLKQMDYDIVVITVSGNYDEAIKTIQSAGVSMDKIRFLN